jgi:hypothetical protein
MPRKEFEAFTRLDASDVNTYLMDQAVMSFAGTASRGSAIATPVEGMTTFLQDSNVLSIYDGSSWKNSLAVTGGILQVLSTSKTDTFTMSSSTFADVTGLSVAITPSSTSNKILVSLSLSGGGTPGVSAMQIKLVRDSTDIALGDTAGSRVRTTIGNTPASDASANPSTSILFLDSPNTTSSTTYKVQVKNNGSGSVWVNRSSADVDNGSYARAVSTITVMEVSS